MSGISSDINSNPQLITSVQHKSGNQLFTINGNRRKWFEKCGANITTTPVLHSGEHSTVYSGQFNKDFSAQQFTEKLKAEKCIRKELAKCGDKFALKCVNTENNNELKDGVERESDVLFECCYQYIIDVYFIVKFAKSDRYYLFIELADTDLEKYLNKSAAKGTKLIEMRAKIWIRTLCNAVKYLHESGISHQNINSSNILVFNYGKRDDIHPQLKLADFASAIKINPIELKNSNIETTLQFDDHFNDDILDLYFVFNEILTQTHMTTDAHTVYNVINQLIRLDGDSISLLDILLSQNNWPLN